MKGFTQMSLFNTFSANASSYVDIINKYYMFSGLNFNAISIHLKWNNNDTNVRGKQQYLCSQKMIDIRGFYTLKNGHDRNMQSYTNIADSKLNVTKKQKNIL